MRCALLLLVAFALVAGCGSDPKGTADGDLVAETQSPGGPDWVKSVEDPEPGRLLSEFVAAAIDKDYRAMWNRFSVGTKQRTGPDFARFRSGVAADFTETIGAFVEGKYEVVTSYETTSACNGCQRIAVASIAGDRVDPSTKKTEHETFGSAFVREPGGWKLEIFGPIALTLLVPEERTPVTTPRVAVDVEAGAPVLEVGLWIDGKQYASPTEGASPTQLTIFAEPEEEFEPGNHTVLALASVGNAATATAWTFIIDKQDGDD